MPNQTIGNIVNPDKSNLANLTSLVDLQNWQVGDLVQLPDRQPLLVLYVDRDDSYWCYLGVINPHGSITELTRMSAKRDATFRHTTGLKYQFISRQQAEQDYQNGVFTPYFEILYDGNKAG